MILDARQPEKPAGVLIDTATGRRIPFARKVDFDKGTYEAFVATADGQNIVVDNDTGKMLLRQGKAIGKLVLVPMAQAHKFGAPSQRVKQTIEPMTADERREGLEVYKKAYFHVWQHRDLSKRCVHDQWETYLLKNCSFLDTFLIRKQVSTT